MNSPVDIRPDHLSTVWDVLREHLPPGVRVWAFGSRTDWTTKDSSDLDLALEGDGKIDSRVLGRLQNDFEESNLPYTVDVVDVHALNGRFKRIVQSQRVPLPSVVEDSISSPSWPEVAIGEIADVVGGGTPSTKDPENFDGDIPWLTPKDLSATHDRYMERGGRNLSEKGLDRSSAKLLPIGSVLLSTRAPIGYVALARNQIATNQGFRSLILSDDAIPEFLYYWLKLNTQELERHASGTTFRELSGSSLKKLRLRLPSLPEQRTIAGILGALDDKIELNRRMNETLEAMARALFRSWFVDFDPVRAKMEGRDTGLPKEIADLFPDRLVDSELGEIPEGWGLQALPELVEVNPQRVLKRGRMAPYVDMSNMPTRGHVPDNILERPFGSGMRFSNGDTLIARITPCLENGKTAYVDFLRDGEVGWGSTEYIVLKPMPPLPDEYAYCLARSARFRDFAVQNMSGTSGRQRVPAVALNGFFMPSPPAQLSAEFGRTVQSLLTRANKAARESRTLATLRDLLLPKLVSGEFRVYLRNTGDLA